MSFSWPSKTTLKSKIKAIWQSHRPDADFSPYSDLWLYQEVTGDAWYRLHQTAKRVLDAVFPKTTYGIYLDHWLTWTGCSDGQGGYGRILARGSEGTDCLEITATSGSSIAIGDQLTDDAGNIYQVDENYTWVADTTYDADCSAVSTGAATNLETGEALTFVSPPAGVTAEAELVDDLDFGVDRETDAAGRSRLLAKLQTPSISGNWADWVETIEAASQGNLKCYVWPGRENPPGWGRTDYLALQTGESGSARHIGSGDTLYSTIAAAVAARMPVLHYKNARQLTITPIANDTDLTVTLGTNADTSDQCDWDAEAAKATVFAISPGSNLIICDSDVCSPDLADGIVSGDRVVIDGQEAIVDVAAYSADPQKFTTTTWPWASGPTVGDYVCSGGGLMGHLVDSTGTADPTGLYGAVQTYHDALGPALGDYAAPITGWTADVTQLGLQSALIVQGAGDIADVTVTAPATDQSPTAGSGTTTTRLVMDELRIWEAK